jgi:hypothetical protein
MYNIVNTYKYMYFCIMENKPIFIQLSFSTSDSYESRFMIVVEVIDEEVQKVHLVPVPSWLVFYSEKYKFYCINLN